MIKLALLPLSLMILTACSHQKSRQKKEYNPTVAEQAEYYRVQEQLIEADLPNCKD